MDGQLLLGEVEGELVPMDPPPPDPADVPIPLRKAREADVPAGARRVYGRMVRPWECRRTYVRGRLNGAEDLTDSLALRFAHPSGWCAVGVWEDGRFRSAFKWHRTNLLTVKRLGANDLARLVGTEEVK